MGTKSGNPQWKDYPDTSTPVTAQALNNIEDALDASGGGGGTEKKYPVVSGMRISFQENASQTGSHWSGSFHPYNYAGPIAYIHCTVATADSAGTLEVAIYDTAPETGMPTTLLIPVASIPLTTTGSKEIAVGEVPTGAGVWIFARMVGATTGQVRGNSNNGNSFGWPMVRFGGNVAPVNLSEIVENPTISGNMHGHSWAPAFGFAW